MNDAVSAGLTGAGTVIYNTVNLSGPELKTTLSMVVNYDRAERTQESVTLRWGFETIVRTADINEVINKLTVPGGMLVITGLGFKDLTINTPGGGGVRDIGWGPKPRVLNWTVFAPGIAWRLNWEVETQIPFCSDGLPDYTNAIKTLNYTVSFDIDEMGLTVRNISGEFTIPITRITQGQRIIPDNAHLHKSVINPEIPLGFRRVKRSSTLSEDRRGLSFDIVDEEIDSDVAYPDGIVKIEIDEDLASQNISMANWSYTLSGTVVVGRPFPKSLGWEKFAMFVAQRVQWQTQWQRPNPERRGIGWLTSVRFTDKVFGRESSFEITWTLFSQLKEILKTSGMFRPVEGTSWSSWRSSMLTGPWKAGGRAGLSYQNSNDLIIDLCQNGEANGAMAAARDNPGENPADKDGQKPDADNSWIDYKCWVEVQESTGVMRHIPLPKTPLTTETPLEFDSIGNTQKPKPKATATTLSTQKRTEESYMVVLCGYALRAGFPIAPPALASFGGKKVRKAGKPIFKTGTYAQGALQVVWATWRIPYLVEQAPADIETPKVPHG